MQLNFCILRMPVTQVTNDFKDFDLNPAPFLEECRIVIVVDFSKAQSTKESIEEEVENTTCLVNKIQIERAMRLGISVSAEARDAKREFRLNRPLTDFGESGDLAFHEYARKRQTSAVMGQPSKTTTSEPTSSANCSRICSTICCLGGV
ncbi:MAG: hypothetical protein WCJ09_12560 [Planctomycetota bacterium]